MGILLYITILVRWILVSIQDCVSPAGPVILAEAAQTKVVSWEWSTAESPNQSGNTGAVKPGLTFLSCFTDVPFSNHAESQLTFFALNRVLLHHLKLGTPVGIELVVMTFDSQSFQFINIYFWRDCPSCSLSGISCRFLFTLNLGVFYEQLIAAKANTIRQALKKKEGWKREVWPCPVSKLLFKA